MGILSRIKEEAARSGSSREKFFFVKDGEKARVRFLQEIDEAYFLRIGELLSRIDGRPPKNTNAKSYANIVQKNIRSADFDVSG